MGMTRSIAGSHAVISILILIACIAVSTLGLTRVVVPEVSSLLDEAAEKYDAFLPEITVRGGQASIKTEEPYYVELGTKDVALVIDTREGGSKNALNYLRTVQTGAVLTRDSLITKNQHQIRVIPLQGLPDLTLNSGEIRYLIERYHPMLTRWIWTAIICYFCLSKPVQLLVLAMIPYFGARSYSVNLSYGQALKVSAFAMAPPVLLDFALGVGSLGITGSFVTYFAVYVGVLIFSVWDLVKSSREASFPTGGIHPS